MNKANGYYERKPDEQEAYYYECKNNTCNQLSCSQPDQCFFQDGGKGECKKCLPTN